MDLHDRNGRNGIETYNDRLFYFDSSARINNEEGHVGFLPVQIVL